MSITYPIYSHSVFPDEVDQFNLFSDVTIDMLPYVKQYQSLYSSGKLSDAAKLLEDHPEMETMVINSSNLNRIIDAIKCMETFYTDDVRKYILELMSFKGEYSSLQKYIRYNVVRYNSMIYLCISDCPLGTLPTDILYWLPLSIRGDKGETGIGLVNYGEWNSLTTYPKDALVSYNNTLWGAIIENTAIVPSTETNVVWTRIMEFSSDYATYTDKTREERYKLVVDDARIYLEEVM